MDSPFTLIILMSKRIHILNTNVDSFTMAETLQKVDKAIKNKQQLHHVAVNAGKIVAMQTNQELRNSVNNSDIISPDGQAVVWASKTLGKPLKERVAGIDLMENLVAYAFENNYKIYLFGAKEDVVTTLVSKYSKKYNSSLIAGYRNGYYTKDEEPKIVENIAKSKAQLLFVAITSPKKENFLYKYKEALKDINFIMGVGGSFDVISGKTKRAPLWMQTTGLEWFYRFLQEPKRMWKRYLVGNTKFIILVLKERLKRS